MTRGERFTLAVQNCPFETDPISCVSIGRMGFSLRWLLISTIAAAGLYGQADQPSQADQSVQADQSAQIERFTQADNSGAEEPAISWKQIPSDVLHAQKQIWLFPTKVVRGQHVVPTILALGSTAGLYALDPTVARYFRDNSTSFRTFNNVFSAGATTATALVVPAAFYLTGLATKNNYTRNTGLLAAEAALNVEIPNLVLRNTTRRLRPTDALAQGTLSDTWFKTTGNPLTATGSFPSGHTAAAFAVATVVADRYRTHRWVPFVAYGLATAIGFSRTSSNSHYLSDVAFGAILGFSVGHWTTPRP
ncbi:MAG: phosphoesterase, PA-phosphatase related [Bryobacterales bacterium]|nr:phosphoesterase, PA-phosphatase related [Bryobacterales bacterium]